MQEHFYKSDNNFSSLNSILNPWESKKKTKKGTKHRINATTKMGNRILRKSKWSVSYPWKIRKEGWGFQNLGGKMKNVMEVRFPDRGDRNGEATGKEEVSQASLVAY